MHTWRRTTRTTYLHRTAEGTPPLSDDCVVNKFELMMPVNMIRLLRLNLFIRVVTGGNSTVQAITFAARKSKHSWMFALRSDFSWVKDQDVRMGSKHFSGIPDLQ